MAIRSVMGPDLSEPHWFDENNNDLGPVSAGRPEEHHKPAPAAKRKAGKSGGKRNKPVLETGGRKVDPKTNLPRPFQLEDAITVPVKMCDGCSTAQELEFYSPSANEQGGSVKITVRFPTEVETALDVIIKSGRWPSYQTHGDVIRHAINRHIFWLNRRWPVQTGIILSLETLTMLHQQRSLNLMSSERLEPLILQVQQCIDAEDFTSARHMIAGIANAVGSQPHSTYKGRVLDKLQAAADDLTTRLEAAEKAHHKKLEHLSSMAVTKPAKKTGKAH